MKTITFAYSFVFLSSLSMLVSNIACAEEPQATLLAQAKVTESAATSTALGRVPGGKVQSAELEKENGHLIWSFDISKSTTPNITEIHVDAINGKIIATEIETKKDQAKEAKTS